MTLKDDMAEDLVELLLDTDDYAETVQMREPTGELSDLVGVWYADAFGRNGDIGSGAARTDAEGQLVVAVAAWRDAYRRAHILRKGQTYRIRHVEPLGDHGFKVHLQRLDGGGVASPQRRDGSRL